MKIFNMRGEHVDTIVEERFPAGNYQYHWDAENLPSGVYFSILEADSFRITKKMILVKSVGL